MLLAQPRGGRDAGRGAELEPHRCSASALLGPGFPLKQPQGCTCKADALQAVSTLPPGPVTAAWDAEVTAKPCVGMTLGDSCARLERSKTTVSHDIAPRQ